MAKKMVFVLVLSGILVAACYGVLRGGRLYGPFVVAMTLVPVVGAKVARLDLIRMLPDFIFGVIDTALLTVAALIGAAGFGAMGAIIGGAVGDGITDAIAGFFEGGIAEWLRAHGIDESRTALGSAFGKMAGCLFGSGVVLTLAWIVGATPAQLLR
jgi:hypothetical protein